jgi:hypothetical protein
MAICSGSVAVNFLFGFFLFLKGFCKNPVFLCNPESDAKTYCSKSQLFYQKITSAQEHEVDLTPMIGQRPGTYRYYLWYNGADFPTIETPNESEHNSGAGISFDQQLLDPIAVFLRLAFQKEAVSEVSVAWSFGVQLLGAWWNRPDDAVAVAIGQALLSDDFKASAEAPARTGDEWFAEAYYRYVWSENLALSVHVQVIDNAGGNKDFDPIAVVGGRAQLIF